MTRQRRADLALLAVAALWGATFVMVRSAVSVVGPFQFLAVRFTLATVVMVLVSAGRLRRAPRATWAAGGLIGVFLFVGYALQTAGLQYTTAARAGFITGMAVVLVPLVAWVWLRRAPGVGPFVGVLLAAAGLVLLSVPAGTSLALNRGDALVLGCACAFALHIVAIARYAPHMDTRALAAIQIGTTALLASAAMALFERPVWPLPPAVLGAAVFTGVLATAVGFSVQTAAQARTTPTHVALIIATEPVFAALAGVLLGHEHLTARDVAGCGLILSGMLVAELWGRWPAAKQAAPDTA